MSISANTFNRTIDKFEASALITTIKDYKWSPADIFLSVITLGSYAAIRVIYQSTYNEDKKVEQYFRGNIALFDAYQNRLTKTVEGKKQLSVILDGYPLVLQETGTTEHPTLTYVYQGKSSCTGDKGIYTTLDAWILTEFAKLASDDCLFELYKQKGGLHVDGRANYSPEKFKTIRANFENVDFEKLTLVGLRLENIKLYEANFQNAKLKKFYFMKPTIEMCNFKNADLEGLIFNKGTIDGTSFLGTDSTINRTIFSHVKIDTNAPFSPTAFPTNTNFDNPLFFFGSTRYRSPSAKAPTEQSTSHRTEHGQKFPNVQAEVQIKQCCIVLGIEKKEGIELTQREVKEAFNREILQLHPDKNKQQKGETKVEYDSRVTVPCTDLIAAKEQLEKIYNWS
ncbi:MAG: hypothetical protein K0R08_1288 [Solimicrobium sp.]|jgi:hypothetical protein|nr:hypothetical protein [Solimicrobium sp.]